MKNAAPVAIRREDYTPPPYRIDRIDLDIDLHETRTVVAGVSEVRREAGVADDTPLVLQGQGILLRTVAVDGVALAPEAYSLEDETLTIHSVPARFQLRCEGWVNPEANKALEGLYLSGGNFCTQCEAEGFRRITWFLDRPDVMARYSCTLRADKRLYPVLLSNGNRIEEGDLPGGRHFATWEDPFPKPSYLFALVAGDLACRRDTFVTASGREVSLEVYVAEADLPQTGHCLASLARAMRWDEEVYGREYDLDSYMIVAVRDFNMGAMENKGLNIFNTKYVLAHPDTATDADFANVESVVAHEYFHNWSGNRVTCRDWFQLSLKEGFTVFRDQEFSADMGSSALQRIQDVQRLQSTQFPEDAGPTAHSVRPDTYVEINNFYTPTVYEKGAEVVRMIRTLIGAEAFRRGTDLYFERHDGQAVTCEDFVLAMEAASGRDLGQFRLWYSQAGTPIVHGEGSHDTQSATYTLKLRQELPDTPGQTDKSPMLIPLATALLDASGADMQTRLQGQGDSRGTHILELTQASQSFVFEGVATPPTPSPMRGFSAPVRLKMPLQRSDLLGRMAADSDPFNRWDASQALGQQRVFEVMNGQPDAGADAQFAEAFARALGSDADEALLAEALTLPSEVVLGDRLTLVDPDRLALARKQVRRELAGALREQLEDRYQALSGTVRDDLSPTATGKRALRNVCLGYLMSIEPAGSGGLAETQLANARNMTEAISALTLLCNVEGPAREGALKTFYDRFADVPLVVDKWFAAQALSSLPDTLERLRALAEHPSFDLQNPNRLRAMVGTFAQANPYRFHALDEDGHRWLADYVAAVDAFNPQVAARMVSPLGRFARFVEPVRTRMVEQLQRLSALPKLSRDLREQIDRGLEATRS